MARGPGFAAWRGIVPCNSPVPGGDVLVGQPRGDIEHDDGALAVDVVTVTQAAELLLAGGVPAVEADLAAVGGEVQGVDLHTDGRLIPNGKQGEGPSGCARLLVHVAGGKTMEIARCA